jgi:hypothetical protein
VLEIEAQDESAGKVADEAPGALPGNIEEDAGSD